MRGGLFLGVLLLTFSLSVAVAAEEKRVYVVFGGSNAEQGTLAGELSHFRSVITDLSAMRFTADREMDVVMAQCREQIGLAATSDRECMLTASRRVMVDLIYELKARSLGRKSFEFTLTVLNDQGEMVYETLTSQEGANLASAAREAYPRLARAYLCRYEKVDGACAEPAPVVPQAPVKDAAVALSEREAGHFLRVKAGAFTMGSPSAESGRREDEAQHQVTLKRDLMVGRTEVTQGEWVAVMGSNPSHFSGCGTKCPVERVSWFDAVTYANTLSRQAGLQECYQLNGCSGSPGSACSGNETRWCEGDYTCSEVVFAGLDCRGYRLPTEAEWEHFARAGSDAAYHSSADLDTVAWYTSNSDEKIRAVGGKSANAWGLHDVHGNVWEWVWDWYGEYGTAAAVDPVGPRSGQARVARGGSWGSSAHSVRAAARNARSPRYRDYSLGFRVVRTVR